MANEEIGGYSLNFIESPPDEYVSNLSFGGQGPSTATLLWQAVLQLLSTGEQKTHRQLPTVQEEAQQLSRH